jgi:hypothetical protein
VNVERTAEWAIGTIRPARAACSDQQDDQRRSHNQP